MNVEAGKECCDVLKWFSETTEKIKQMKAEILVEVLFIKEKKGNFADLVERE